MRLRIDSLKAERDRPGDRAGLLVELCGDSSSALLRDSLQRMVICPLSNDLTIHVPEVAAGRNAVAHEPLEFFHLGESPGILPREDLRASEAHFEHAALRVGHERDAPSRGCMTCELVEWRGILQPSEGERSL